MSNRDEYLKSMHAALERLQVKASLAKLEARDVRDDLLKKYDSLHDRLNELRESSGDRWDALKEGADSAWHSFKKSYDEVMAAHRGDDA